MAQYGDDINNVGIDPNANLDPNDATTKDVIELTKLTWDTDKAKSGLSFVNRDMKIILIATIMFAILSCPMTGTIISSTLDKNTSVYASSAILTAIFAFFTYLLLTLIVEE